MPKDCTQKQIKLCGYKECPSWCNFLSKQEEKTMKKLAKIIFERGRFRLDIMNRQGEIDECIYCATLAMARRVARELGCLVS